MNGEKQQISSVEAAFLRQGGVHVTPTHSPGHPMPTPSDVSSLAPSTSYAATPANQRRLPQVEQLLQQPFLARFIEALSRPLVTQAVRDTLSELRQS